MRATINNRIYDELADAWWDENGFLHLLKAMVNPWRVPYFTKALQDSYGQDLKSVRLLDVGCGGGVLAEEFSRLGCRVSGIDISPRAISGATSHAAGGGLFIDYVVASALSLPFGGNSFEAVSCCDVLEHVPDWRQVIAEAGHALVPGGLFFFDTINRNKKSRELFIKGLQEISFTKLMPPDTHVWEMFITPDELTESLRQQCLLVEDLCGGKIPKNPLATLWEVRQHKRGRITVAELGRRLELKPDPDLSLNYLGYARKTV